MKSAAMRRARSQGFSFIELMLVVMVIGILIAMTIPGLKETAMRKQVKEGLELADVAKKGVGVYYALTGLMPVDNTQAGVPPADKIIGQFNTAVTVKDGAITLTYGNNAGKSIEGKLLTLRPAIVPGYPTVPISWICNEVSVPTNMELRGENATNIPMEWLPVECRQKKK
jgi:type IV pilus assembly protein PilA